MKKINGIKKENPSKKDSELKKKFGGLKKNELDVQPINVFALMIEYPS